ncbi:MAG TPA: hypothetical protein VIK89_08875 [Cytophagaceae bacterium]
MATRFKVARKWVKWKGKVYYEGELLPPNFTEKDKYRNIYSRRLIKVEIPDEPTPLSTNNETQLKQQIEQQEQQKEAVQGPQVVKEFKVDANNKSISDIKTVTTSVKPLSGRKPASRIPSSTGTKAAVKAPKK